MNTPSETMNYFSEFDSKVFINELDTNGYSFLPSIKKLGNFNEILDLANKELVNKTYLESSKSHALLEETLDLKNNLEPILFSYAKEQLNFKGSIDNQYKISRHILPGKSSEAYRGHFDSHIFTIVFPVVIPTNEGHDGSLIAFPKIRNDTSFEIVNIFQKAFYKIFSNQKGMDILSKRNKNINFKFFDFRPVIFLGRTTFHCNHPLSSDSKDSRITFLSHYFDRNPTYSVGNLLRILRNR